MLGFLRRISVIESVSYLALLVAVIVKRTGGTELGVQLIGPIHGVLFLAFVWAVLQTFKQIGWSFLRAVQAVVLGSLPLGGIWLERNWLAEAESDAG